MCNKQKHKDKGKNKKINKKKRDHDQKKATNYTISYKIIKRESEGNYTVKIIKLQL